MKYRNESILPITKDLWLPSALSLVVALAMAVASLAGLLFQAAVYPTEELRRSFVSNDLVNLFIGLPILLGSLWFARRGKLVGLLLWPGALFYVTYNYIAYAFAVSLSAQFVPYMALAALSVYAIFQLFSSMDLTAIRERLIDTVPARLAGGVLAGLGGLFFLRGIGQVVGVLNGQISLARPEAAVLVADFVIMPFWVLGGLSLWRKQSLGYASGAGLLFQGSMLFIGLLVFFILQPFLAAVPFPVEDFVVIFVMGLICFIPFGLFVRGIVKK